MIKLANIKPLGMVYSPVDCNPTKSGVTRMVFSSGVKVMCFFISIFKVLDIGLLPLHDLFQVVIYGLARRDMTDMPG